MTPHQLNYRVYKILTEIGQDLATPLIPPIIQLSNQESYSLGSSPTGLPSGTAIFMDSNGQDELIAVVKNVTLSDFSSGFSFV
ncbi:MAG: hypothetical protein F6K14_03950 [Symploca sp. SIO2C1]|nr:hypothetical protein [Symploca sp. SIO2C1]